MPEEVPPLVPVEPLDVFRVAEHEAVAPPLLPAQFQLHGPAPLTADAVPTLQRLVVGALVRLAPFEEPHAPFTACAEVAFSAEQVAVVPPLLPAQVHDHGPAPLIADVVPALQRLAVGVLVRVAPFDEPHAPVTFVPPLGVVDVANVAYKDHVADVQLSGEVLNLLGMAPKLYP